jgi:GPI transamidase subunit PIG-U
MNLVGWSHIERTASSELNALDAMYNIRLAIGTVGAVAARLHVAQLAPHQLSSRPELVKLKISSGVLGLERAGCRHLRGCALNCLQVPRFGTNIGPCMLHVCIANGPLWACADAGSACRIPPLLLRLLQPFARSPAVTALPSTAADMVSAMCLVALANAAACQGSKSCTWLVAPWTMATLILWNPLLILSAAAASTASMAVAAVLLSALCAARSMPILSAAACAVAVYIRPHCIFFAVPLLLLLLQGPEDLKAWPSGDAHRIAHTPGDLTCKPTMSVRSQRTQGYGWRIAVLFNTALMACLLCLLALSDIDVQHRRCVMNGGHCTWWQAARHCWQGASSMHHWAAWLQGGQRQQVPTHSHWMAKVYGGLWTYDDLTVNIGLWWCALAMRLCALSITAWSLQCLHLSATCVS